MCRAPPPAIRPHTDPFTHPSNALQDENFNHVDTGDRIIDAAADLPPSDGIDPVRAMQVR